MTARAELSDLLAPAASCVFRVPGRIEVLGKHTDYAGGRSLLAAVERGITVTVAARNDGRVTVRRAGDGDLDTVQRAGASEHANFPLDPGLALPGAGDWRSYPMVVARRLVRNFPGMRRGADILLESDLPEAAGLSSSSAVVTGIVLALAVVNGLVERCEFREAIGDREALAGYLAAAEGGWEFRGLAGGAGVGTRGGAEDHVAIVCSLPKALVQYAFDPVRFEASVPVPEGWVFAIASSGARAEKTGASRERYNRASDLMNAAAERWRRETGHTDRTLGAAVAADPAAADRIRTLCASGESDAATDQVVARIEQFLEESLEIVPGAADALERGDLDAFGAFVDRSQALAEDALGNQVPETVALARLAPERGAAAASAFGAGFGGSVWALVEAADAAEFIDDWRAKYLERFPALRGDAEFFITRAGDSVARPR